jgi:hypothetical protein
MEFCASLNKGSSKTPRKKLEKNKYMPKNISKKLRRKKILSLLSFEFFITFLFLPFLYMRSSKTP